MFLLPGGYKVWFHQLFDINLMHGGTLGLYGVHVVTTGQQIGFCMCKRSTQKAISSFSFTPLAYFMHPDFAFLFSPGPVLFTLHELILMQRTIELN